MIQTVVIRPKYTGTFSPSMSLPGEYRGKDGKTYRRLIENNRITSSVDHAGDKVYNIKFSKHKIEEKIVYDDSEDIKYNPNRELVKFYMKHPQIWIVGGDNSHNQQPLYELINLTSVAKKNYEWNNNRRDVANYLNSLSEEELVDVAYRYGEDPKNKGYEEVYNLMGDFQSGKLMQIDEKTNMAKKFLEDENSADRDVVTIARKAIASGVITVQDEMYYILGKAVGRSFNDVLLYCKGNVQEYESFIVPQVKESFGDPVAKKKGRPAVKKEVE